MNRNNKVHIYYLAISREEETSENCESFSELKDLYKASVNPQALPEGLNWEKNCLCYTNLSKDRNNLTSTIQIITRYT